MLPVEQGRGPTSKGHLSKIRFCESRSHHLLIPEEPNNNITSARKMRENKNNPWGDQGDNTESAKQLRALPGEKINNFAAQTKGQIQPHPGVDTLRRQRVERTGSMVENIQQTEERGEIWRSPIFCLSDLTCSMTASKDRASYQTNPTAELISRPNSNFIMN